MSEGPVSDVDSFAIKRKRRINSYRKTTAFVLQLKSWILKREYTSPEILNEIIAIMGQSILHNLLSHIHSSLWVSIFADEATDISRNEQMSTGWVA